MIQPIELPIIQLTPIAMITTTDNPYNPFTQFDTWKAYDDDKGYHTCEYLARIAVTSHITSESDENLAIDEAIDEIVELNLLGIYKKVTLDDYPLN
jgi:hypothetical protein